MLSKIVDGVEVQCTSEEEAEIRAEWAKTEANKPVLVGTPSLEELVAQAVKGNA